MLGRDLELFMTLHIIFIEGYILSMPLDSLCALLFFLR